VTSDAASAAEGSRRLDSIDVRSWSATHPFAVDLTIATVVVAGALAFEATDAGEVGATLDAVDLATGAVAFALILLRRRAPLPVLVAALIAGIWSMLPDDDHAVLQVAVFLALYTVASTSNRRTAWTAGAVTAGVLFLTAVLTTSAAWYDSEGLELVAWALVATAVGDATRSRRAYVAAIQERAERAEHALEEEARRQVMEERLRIARELHDVVAHHIAVINVQAGVATHLVRDDPAGAEEALTHVRRGAKSVLDEMSGILSVLRRPDETTTATDPLPTLDQLDGLIASFNDLGFEVEWHTTGERQGVAPAVQLAAYRIVQESLTNAHRHGRSPRACLRVDYTRDTLSVEVLNDAATSRSTPGRRGHGIIGMRERAAAAGGTIDVGPTADRRFRVFATLPVTGDDR
jgi:signal transduction histidine kinase